jgi:hypothetical protein
MARVMEKRWGLEKRVTYLLQKHPCHVPGLATARTCPRESADKNGRPHFHDDSTGAGLGL